MIAREGYLIIFSTLVICSILLFIGIQLGSSLGMFLASLSIIFLLMVVLFFRDPERLPPDGADSGSLLLAPADGKVVMIKEVEEPHYIKGPANQLSIFLSVFDVHVNRIPATGEIEYCKYIPGEYLVAWHPKSSEKNERSEFGLQHDSGTRIFFKQIAGLVARRIVYHISEGDRVNAGDRFGVVKFGSRMDVIVPLTINFDVQVGDAVRAGKTVLGRLPTAKAEIPGSDIE